MSKENKCAECQQSTIINEEDYNCYWLIKGNNWKVVCPNCYDKNQVTYKQEYEKIKGMVNEEPKFIKAKCDIEGCGKSFLTDEVENERHSWQLYVDLTTEGGRVLESLHRLDEDDHYELNKDPSPVKDMEELVHRWMKQKGWVKLKCIHNTEFNTYQDAEDDDLGVWFRTGSSGWDKKVLEWLKTQPNRQTIRKDNTNNNRERERERERANSTTNTGTWEYNQPNSWTRTGTEWSPRAVRQFRKKFRKRSKKDRLNSLDNWRNSVGGGSWHNYLLPY